VIMQLDVTSSIRIGSINLNMELDIECCRTERSEVNEQLEVTNGIRIALNYFGVLIGY